MSAAVFVFYDDSSDTDDLGEVVPSLYKYNPDHIETIDGAQYVSPEHHGLTSYPNYYLLHKFVGKTPGQSEEFTTNKIDGKYIILGPDSFKNNPYITKLTITSDVTTYYAGFASNCINLEEIIVTGGVQFTSKNGVMYYNPDTASDKNVRLYLYPAGKTDETFTLGEDVRIIRSYAFEGAQNLKTVVLNNGLEKIESYSFRYSSLESITIPSNVNTLGVSAFAECDKLETVTFESSSKIKTIGNNAFLNCSSIEEIIIPEGVTSIGANAFKGCTSLKEITIPESVTSIGANAFEGCTELETLSMPIDVEITKGMFSDCENLKEITLTKGKDGKGHNYSRETYMYTPWNDFSGSGELTLNMSDDVVHIGNYTFYGCKALTAASFSNNLTSIGYNAFYGCENLTDIIIPNTVTTIGDNAFQNTGLTEVTIPDSVKRIGAGAFEGCEDLDEVIIKGDVTIENGAFKNAGVKTLTIPSDLVITEGMFDDFTDLEEIIIVPGTATIDFDANSIANAPWNVGDGNLKITIESGITGIGDNIFSGCKNLTEIELPDGIETIGDNAFKGTGLTSVTIPATVTEIGEGVFSGSKNLNSVDFKGDNIAEISKGAFEDCTSLTEITIPNNVGTIGDNAFRNTGLTEITIPSSITEIGDGVFENCNDLVNVYAETGGRYMSENGVLYDSSGGGTVIGLFPIANTTDPIAALVVDGGNVTVIGNGAFEGLEFDNDVITIPGYVQTIEDEAFKDTNITSIKIPSTVTTIGDNVFEGCTNLTNIEVTGENGNYVAVGGVLYSSDMTELIRYPPGKDISTFEIPNTVTTIHNGAFADCIHLTEITIPDSVTTIGDNAFKNAGLEFVTIPENVTEIGKGAFSGCGELGTVTFDGNKVESIGEGAFEDCVSLKKINIPDSVTTIGDNAFKNAGLESVTIPGSSEIGKGAFSGCADLESVTFVGTGIETIAEGAFEDCVSLKIINIPDSVTTIGDNAFKNAGLESVTIPENVTEIGDSAFRDTGLTEIIIPNSVTTIGDNAFRDTGSTEITIPNSVTTIGDNAFRGTNATEIVIPDSVETIGDNAFKNSGLTKIEIPDSVKTIGIGAFEGCEDLDEVIIKGDVTIENGAFKNAGVKTLTIPSDLVITEGMFDDFTDLEEIIIVPGTATIDFDANSIANAPWNVGDGNLKITIESGITGIGDNIFSGCKNLTEIELPDGIETIGDNAFKGTGLTSVTIPATVTGIGEGVFSGSKNLNSVDFKGDNITEISKGAFEDCTSLKAIKIPESVTSIGDDAFQNSGLNSILFSGDAPVLGSSVFPDGTTIYHKDGTSGFDDQSWKDLDLEIKTVLGSEGYVITFGDGITIIDENNTPITSGENIPFGTVLTVTADPLDGHTPVISPAVGENGEYVFLGATEFKVTYNINSYTILVDDGIIVTDENDNPVKNGDSIPFDAILTVTAAPKTGYTSVLSADVGTIGIDGKYTVKSNVLFSVTHTAIEYTISFGEGITVKDGTTEISTGDQITYGTVITVTADPKTGHTSELSATAGTIGNDGKYTVEGEVTFSVTHTVIEYTITWDIDGVETTEKFTYDATAEYTGDTPTKASTEALDFIFSGWSPELAKVTQDQVYVAQFSESAREYTITFGEGLTVTYENGDPVGDDDISYGTIVIVTADLKEGFTPVISPTVGENGKYVIQGETDFTVTYEISKYTVTWIIEGSDPIEMMMEPGAAITPPADPTREGYIFDGWANVPATMPAEDIIIKSLWKLKVTGDITSGDVSDIKDFIDENDKPTIQIKSDDEVTIDSSIFENLGDKTLVVEIVDDDGEVVERWALEGLLESDDDVIINVNQSTPDEELIEKVDNPTGGDLVVLEITADNVPDGTTVKYYVGSTYEPGDKLNHYYYDESGNVKKTGVVDVDEDGYVTIPVLGYGTTNAFAFAIIKAPGFSAGYKISYIFLEIILISAVVLLFYYGRKGNIAA